MWCAKRSVLFSSFSSQTDEYYKEILLCALWQRNTSLYKFNNFIIYYLFKWLYLRVAYLFCIDLLTMFHEWKDVIFLTAIFCTEYSITECRAFCYKPTIRHVTINTTCYTWGRRVRVPWFICCGTRHSVTIRCHFFPKITLLICNRKVYDKEELYSSSYIAVAACNIGQQYTG